MELYVVVGVSLIVWCGLFFYMNRLDSRIRDLEKRK